MHVLCLISLGLLSSSWALESAPPSLVSGPATGSPLKPLVCYAERGPLAGQEFDAAAQAGAAPAAFLFIHELSRNTAPLIRELDRLGQDHALLGFRWYAILLEGDRTEGENKLKRVNTSLNLDRPLVLSVDGLEGPGDYALNRRAALTLVFAKDGQVTESIALTDTGPSDFPRLQAGVESVAGKLPSEEAALREMVYAGLPADTDALRHLAAEQLLENRRLRSQVAELMSQERGRGGGANRSQRMERRSEAAAASAGPEPARDQPATDQASGDTTPAVKRRGRPPEDPKLNALLRSFIRKTNDDQRSTELFEDITARAAQSDDLRVEAVEMFKLMLSFPDRYGTERAQALAKSFLVEHAALDDM